MAKNKNNDGEGILRSSRATFVEVDLKSTLVSNAWKLIVGLFAMVCLMFASFFFIGDAEYQLNPYIGDLFRNLEPAVLVLTLLLYLKPVLKELGKIGKGIIFVLIGFLAIYGVNIIDLLFDIPNDYYITLGLGAVTFAAGAFCVLYYLYDAQHKNDKIETEEK